MVAFRVSYLVLASVVAMATVVIRAQCLIGMLKDLKGPLRDFKGPISAYFRGNFKERLGFNPVRKDLFSGFWPYFGWKGVILVRKALFSLESIGVWVVFLFLFFFYYSLFRP